LAQPEQADEILSILYDVLDPFVGHLPSKQKLLELTGQRLVFCAVQNGRILAAVCLERMGKCGIYIYQDAVIKAYQSSGIGIWLLQFALANFQDCCRFSSWTEDSNKASNRMHRMMGMEYDGLKDSILIYQ